jgi:hypothetical protein
MGLNISKKATINVSADHLWSILADDFDKIGEWARGVDISAANTSAEVPGGASVGGRVCQAPGFGAINETFTEFDAQERTYAFKATATKIPSFVRNITNHTAVKVIGPDRAEVQLRLTADTSGLRGAIVKPLMIRKFGAALDAAIEDMTIFAESGQISSEKTKALAKAGH